MVIFLQIVISVGIPNPNRGRQFFSKPFPLSDEPPFMVHKLGENNYFQLSLCKLLTPLSGRPR